MIHQKPAKAEKYLEDDDKLHRKLVVSCDIATEPMVEAPVRDNEETRSLILHERLLLAF